MNFYIQCASQHTVLRTECGSHMNLCEKGISPNDYHIREPISRLRVVTDITHSQSGQLRRLEWLGYGPDVRRIMVRFLTGAKVYRSPKHPDQPHGIPSLLFRGYTGVKWPGREVVPHFHRCCHDVHSDYTTATVRPQPVWMCDLV